MNGRFTVAAVIIISFFLMIINIVLFNGIYFSAISVIFALLACLTLCVSHGKGRVFSAEFKILIIITFFSVIIMLLFKSSTFFRPLTALTIVAGMYFGASAGYICGIFTVIISSFAFFGIGSWTPFQIITMGIIGFVAAIFNKIIFQKNILLMIYSGISSFLFLCVDNIQLIWTDKNGFDYTIYPSLLVDSLKYALIYAVSDILIILLLKNIFGNKLKRLKKRLRIFEYS